MRSVVVAAGVLLAGSAFAQTPIAGTEQLRWEQPGAPADRFEFSVDGGPPLPVTTVLAAGTYSASLPAMTTGPHQIALRACNVAGCGPAAVLSVVLTVLPGQPVNVRVERVPGG